VGDTVFINGRAVVHKGSAGQSIAFPDVCLCPPTPPAGPIPTPLPNTVMAADFDGGARSVLTEGNPVGKQTSFFKKSTGNEPSQPTGGGVVTHGVQGMAYFQSFASNVMIEGEPAVRHLDLLTHNHLAQAPGNTPPVPWLSVQDLPPMPPPEMRRSDKTDGPGLRLSVRTSAGAIAEPAAPADVQEAGGASTPTTIGQGKLDKPSAKGRVTVRYHELKRAMWTKSQVVAGEPVELAVLSTGYPDGTAGTFEIRHHGDPESAPPVAEIKFTLADDKARADWKYEQPLSESAKARLTFIAHVEGGLAHGGLLRVEALPLSDVRGIKQLLRRLGYDSGPPDASEGGPLDDAIKQFQTDHPPLEASGKRDARTMKTLASFARTEH
jgi:hypothetical protein